MKADPMSEEEEEAESGTYLMFILLARCSVRSIPSIDVMQSCQ